MAKVNRVVPLQASIDALDDVQAITQSMVDYIESKARMNELVLLVRLYKVLGHINQWKDVLKDYDEKQQFLFEEENGPRG